MTIFQALSTSQLDRVQRFVRDTFDLEISASNAAEICARWRKFNPRMVWTTSAGPAIWIKSRLAEMAAFKDVPHSPPEDFDVTAILHVFFLFLEETSDMIERLRNDRTPVESEVARSKVSTTTEKITPVDRVAGRVAPVEVA